MESERTHAKATAGPKTARAASSGRTPAAVPGPLALHDLAGNRALDALLRTRRVQARSAVSQPGDPWEQEADGVAASVVAGGAPPTLQRACACGGTTPCGCEEKEELVQRKAEAGGDGTAATARRALLPSSGRPLDSATRSFFEAKFGRDFADVRVHTDAGAEQAARTLSAEAFTMGRDIGFARGRFSPVTEGGRRLLAHELVHVVQQGRAADRPEAVVQRQSQTSGGEALPATEGGGGARRADPAAVDPVRMREGARSYRFQGFTVSDDREFMRGEMRRLIASRGLNGADIWIENLNGNPRVTLPFSAHTTPYARGPVVRSAYDEVQQMREEERRLLPYVNDVYRSVRAEAEAFIPQFEDRAKDIVRALLVDSETRANEERIRYGLTREFRERKVFRRGDYGEYQPPETETTVHYGMQRNVSSQGMAGAAKDLHEKRTEISRLLMRRNGLTTTMCGDGHCVTTISDPAEYDRLTQEITQKEREFDLLRGAYGERYPVLADLANDPSALERLSRGTSPESAAIIGEEIFKRLDNIREVREGLNTGDRVKIWKLPRIVTLTKSATQATGDTPRSRMRGRVVDDKVRQVEADEFWTNLALGVLAVALAILAIPTVGGSLAGLGALAGLGLSATLAFQHLREFQIESAMAGSDFDKARAISAEAPSFFWLAVDIVGAALDVGPAARASRQFLERGVQTFRALRRPAQAALTASGAEAAESLTQLRNAAEHAPGGGRALASRVSETAQQIRGGGIERAAGAAGHEARAVSEATQAARQEIASGARAVDTLAGGQLHVTRAGRIWSCVNPCLLLRERFRNFLARTPEMEQRIVKLEERAAAATTDAERDLIAREAQALERDMRTTALPGDWTSPLQGSADYSELVRRRGTVAAALDRHPPNWHGADEARFRFGHAAEPPPGYHWVLTDSGELRLDRIAGRTDLPRMQFNPATGVFEEVAEDIVRATIREGTQETRPLARVTGAQRAEFDRAFADRARAIQQRDALQALQPLNPEQERLLSRLQGEINEASRRMGEYASVDVMRSRGARPRYPPELAHGRVGGSRAGDFDQVWELNGEFWVVEAKGGSGRLGTRIVEGGARAEQGTREYLLSIANNMANRGADRGTRDLGAALIEAARATPPRVRYVSVRAPIGTRAGQAVAGDIQVAEFAL